MSISNETRELLAEVERRFFELDNAVYELAKAQGLKGNPNGVYFILKEQYKAHSLLRKIEQICENVCY
jgi:hypothetical protein